MAQVVLVAFQEAQPTVACGAVWSRSRYSYFTTHKLEIGDIVVVPVNISELRVARVVSTTPDSRETERATKWVVAPVDMDEHRARNMLRGIPAEPAEPAYYTEAPRRVRDRRI